MRLDKFLKVSRLIKRRTVANEACDNARVTVNGRHVPRAAGIILPALDKRQNFCYHCILFRLSNDKESDRPWKS